MFISKRPLANIKAAIAGGLCYGILWFLRENVCCMQCLVAETVFSLAQGFAS
jgi:hypothetical protein